MSKATESALGDLHGLLAQVLAEKLESGEATAADLAQARQFLKDNNIEASKENPAMDRLSKASVLPFPVASDDEKEQYAL